MLYGRRILNISISPDLKYKISDVLIKIKDLYSKILVKMEQLMI